MDGDEPQKDETSPVYTGCLNWFRIRTKLNWICVNALIQIVNRFTQPTHRRMWVEPWLKPG